MICENRVIFGSSPNIAGWKAFTVGVGTQEFEAHEDAVNGLCVAHNVRSSTLHFIFSYENCSKHHAHPFIRPILPLFRNESENRSFLGCNASYPHPIGQENRDLRQRRNGAAMELAITARHRRLVDSFRLSRHVRRLFSVRQPFGMRISRWYCEDRECGRFEPNAQV